MVGRRMRKKTKNKEEKTNKIITVILDYIFPPRCPVCDKIVDADTVEGRRFIHDECEKKLIYVKGDTCMRCGAPLQKERTEYCSDCSKKKHVAFRQGKALFVYKGDIKKTMYRFKYYNKREYADFFAAVAAEKYTDWIKKNKIQAIVSVPMYSRKQKLRGYNQAEIFARALSKELGIPYLVGATKRIVDTAPMKEVSGSERKNNLKNAFQCEEKVVQYDYILLVDDIYTTGSTADAMANTMVRAGVSNVFLLSICIGQGF